MQQYQSVCRKCGFIFQEGASKEAIRSGAERSRCMMCNADKWKIVEKDSDANVIDTTEDSDNEDDDFGQSSLTDY